MKLLNKKINIILIVAICCIALVCFAVIMIFSCRTNYSILVDGETFKSKIASDTLTTIIFDYGYNHTSIVENGSLTQIIADTNNKGYDNGGISIFFSENKTTAYVLCKNDMLANEDSSMMFCNRDDVQKDETLPSLTSISFNNFDTKNVTDMSYMFSLCTKLTEIDLTKLNTTNVVDMKCIFAYCLGLTSLDVSCLDTSSATNMMGMFYGCSNVTALDLSNFNTANVTDMSYMFFECSKLNTLDLSNLNTSNVTSMYSMFEGCSKLSKLDLSSFNTLNVIDMKYMFNWCLEIKTIYVGSSWNTDLVTSSTGMFRFCSKLFGGAGTTYNASYTDKTYARVDGGTASPGYLTLK